MRRLGAVSLAVTAIVLAVGALSAVLGLLSSDGGGGVVTARFGWLLLAFAVVILSVVTWLLLAQERTTSDPPEGPVLADCVTCGREVIGTWRMCPYCGTVLDGSGRARPGRTVE